MARKIKPPALTPPEAVSPSEPAAHATPTAYADVGIVVTERGERDSCLGRVLQLKVFRPGYTPLTWGEVWARFAQAYPGRWAVQVFPPAERLLDSKDVYHLFLMLEGEPAGLDLR